MNVKVTDKLDVVVIDDFLDLMSHNLLNQGVKDASVWGVRETISLDVESGDPRLCYGFSSTIVDDQKPEYYYDIETHHFIKIVKYMNERVKDLFRFKQVFRCRMDMTTYRGDNQVTCAPHIDYDGKHFTSIYHLSECNAPTIIYNQKLLTGDVPDDMVLTEKQRIEAKPNRLIIFNGNYVHTGMCPTDAPIRILINTNYKL